MKLAVYRRTADNNIYAIHDVSKLENLEERVENFNKCETHYAEILDCDENSVLFYLYNQTKNRDLINRDDVQYLIDSIREALYYAESIFDRWQYDN